MKEWSNLAKVVYARTYARKDSGTLETWEQTVERAIMGNVRGHNVPEPEVKALLKLAKERKAGPAGRGYWFSGTEAHKKVGGVALCNCWALDASDWNHYVIAQDLLMLGGGVGLSVESKFVDKLPRIKKGVKVEHKATKDADFIVPDSREGWCELTRRVLESFFSTGRSFTYSTICLRGYGEPIKGFGGVSSGPLPMIDFVSTLCGVLQAKEGGHLNPLGAADIMTAIGQMIVAGNVRRSAIIILGDCWDKEYLKAKRWDLQTLPTHRARANYSVICDDVDDLHPLFWKTYEVGEPFGIVNRSAIRKYGRMGVNLKDNAYLVNPCQPEWATVLTPCGIKQLKDVDAGDLIWSGKEFTKIVRKWSTGAKPVFSYETRAGVFYGTENHRVVSRGEKVEAGQAETIDTSQGPDYGVPWAIDPQDVMDGLVIGDGTKHKASNNLVLLIIGSKDSDYHNSEIKHLIVKHRPGISEDDWQIITTIRPEELPKTYDRTVPERFLEYKRMAGFLRGLFSANGSIAGSRVTLKASSLKIILKVQEMLSAMGIRSYYTVNKGKVIKFNNGEYQCRQSYDLNIGTDRDKFFYRIGFLQKYKMEALKALVDRINAKSVVKQSYDVVDVTPLGEHEVFDLTVEAEDHTYWTGGLLVSNCGEATLENGEPCNLLEIALCNLKNPEEFVEASRLMFRYGKRVCLEDYHHELCNSVIKRNMRVGVGITGCLSSPLFEAEHLDRAYNAIIEEDKKYSKELGVNQSIRHTVVKPSGTMGKVYDCNGEEGIHAALAPYIIQRIQFASNDPLLPRLRESGHHMEPLKNFDGSVDPRTMVVDFYVAAPDGAPTVATGWDTFKQLDTLKKAQKHWADQAVSVTVYYTEDNLPKVKDWLKDNLEEVKSISFLKYAGHGFQQAPKEPITKEQYEKLSEQIKPLNMDAVGEGELLSSVECEGGVCPVK